MKNSIVIPALLVAALAFVQAAHAQESGALLDLLVKKKIVTDQEAEEVRAELVKEFASTSAGKLNLSSSITEMKLGGDLRVRYQYDNRQNQVADTAHDNQRSRWRFRLRLNWDVQLTDNFFAGLQLQTSQSADSGNQTYQDGFDNYNIFISKAFVGWTPTNYLTFVLGKQKNPFYTTDLVWDADVNPQGLVEQLDLMKAIDPGSPFGLTLIAGQFIFDDNNEFAVDSDLNTDAYMFVQQAVASYKFNTDVSVTIAPGFMTYTAAALTGLRNENAFTDAGATSGLPAVSGESRDLNIITLPGEIGFKIAGLKTRLYWDLAYNVSGQERMDRIYQFGLLAGGEDTFVNGFQQRDYSTRDGLAWLVGLQLGETKKKGDWLAYINYRESGIASVDPNLNDSDFALGELNTRGFKAGIGYAFTDAVVLNITGYTAWNLNEDLLGFRATSAPAIADANAVKVLQVDFNVKF